MVSVVGPLLMLLLQMLLWFYVLICLARSFIELHYVSLCSYPVHLQMCFFFYQPIAACSGHIPLPLPPPIRADTPSWILSVLSGVSSSYIL